MTIEEMWVSPVYQIYNAHGGTKARMVEVGGLYIELEGSQITSDASKEWASTVYRIDDARKGIKARMVKVGKLHIVLEGSQITLDDVSNYEHQGKKARRKYSDAIDSRGILKRSLTFKSPSGASDFVMNSVTSGPKKWVTGLGVQYRDREQLK